MGAWVRWWFPGCTVNPSARELTLAASRSAVSPWKEQVPVCVDESPSRAARRRISQLQLQLLLLLAHCPLPTLHAHCPRPLPLTPAPYHHHHHHPRSPLVDDDRLSAASVLWADGRAVHSSIPLGDHCPTLRVRAVALGLRHGRRPSPRGVASSTWLELQAWRCGPRAVVSCDELCWTTVDYCVVSCLLSCTVLHDVLIRPCPQPRLACLQLAHSRPLCSLSLTTVCPLPSALCPRLGLLGGCPGTR